MAVTECAWLAKDDLLPFLAMWPRLAKCWPLQQRSWPGEAYRGRCRMTAPAVVIGAGPYGLSVAAHLRARGVPVRVFGEVMSSWRLHMPRGMCLKSTPDCVQLV